MEHILLEAGEELSFESGASLEDAEISNVQVFDSIELAKPETTPEGYLRAEAVIAKAGICQSSHNGASVREYVPASERFSAAALRTYSLLPLTNNHPADGLLSAGKKVKQHQIGTIGNPRRRGDLLVADVLITDPEAIADAKAGKNKLSVGENAAIYFVKGAITVNGVRQEFDSIRTKPRGNHVAMVFEGAAGDVARMRMDQKMPATGADKETKVGIKIGDKEYDEAGIEALLKEKDAAQAALTTRLDALTAEHETAKGQLAVLAAPVETPVASDAAEVAEKVVLVLSAQKVLGKDPLELAKLDSMQLMKDVISKERPKLDLAGASKDFIKGVFSTLAGSATPVQATRMDTATVINALSAGGNTAPAKSGAERLNEARAKMTAAYNKPLFSGSEK